MYDDEPSGPLLLDSWHLMDLMIEVFPLPAPAPKHRVSHGIHSPLVGQEEDLLPRDDHFMEEVDVCGHPPLVHLSDNFGSLCLPSIVISHHSIWMNVPERELIQIYICQFMLIFIFLFIFMFIFNAYL